MSSVTLKPVSKVRGEIALPGDKSVSHRSMMFGSLADGVTEVDNFLESEDCIATRRAFELMGVRIETPGPGRVTMHGAGVDGLREPAQTIDVGNSGTSIRLLTGILAGQHFRSRLDGDVSIRRRPMKRVVEPLRKMGAIITGENDGQNAPLVVGPLPAGVSLTGIDHVSSVASAQVKSAILLAGLFASGVTSVSEPAVSRDHTERMFAHFGVKLKRSGKKVSIAGGQRLKAAPVTVPGDISSAAFFLVAGLLAGEGELVLKNVGVNPTRDGILAALERMGALIERLDERVQCGEPVATLRVRPAKLKDAQIGGALIPRLIDEVPALAVAAAFAHGQTVIKNAEELRVKESDRIATMAEGLREAGIKVQETNEGMKIFGDPSHRVKATRFKSHGDHRVAMSLSLLSLRADEPIEIDDTDCVATSFPGFFRLFGEVTSA